jgi:hypothetical protein
MGHLSITSQSLSGCSTQTRPSIVAKWGSLIQALTEVEELNHGMHSAMLKNCAKTNDQLLSPPQASPALK